MVFNFLNAYSYLLDNAKELDAIALLLLFALTLPFSLQAQDPVTIGTILEVSPKTGTLSIRPDNAPGVPIVYYGMDRANLQTTAG
jgi:hypothetical protein